MAKKPDDTLPDREIAERMERALKRSFQMPHKPRQSKAKTRPASKGRVRKGRSRS
jgi:hypothetical protein